MLGKKMVTISGGTGGFTVNKGLHGYPVEPTAICTVFDSGGSTGKLRDEFGWLPQGDVRRCLLALTDDTDDTLRTIFNHRFANDNSSLSNHSLGNLLLLAAEQHWGPVEGIKRIGHALRVRGAVLPVSTNKAHLCAELSDKSMLSGEGAIDALPNNEQRTITRVWLEPQAFITREAAEAIVAADTIILGPGDLYTSIVPNLLVSGMQEALAQSKATLIYIANTMTKWAETREYDVADFAQTLIHYGVGRPQFDVVIINTALSPQPSI